MGIVFGMTGTKGPAYTVIHKVSDYEIRQYSAYVTAEVSMTPGDQGDAFTTLAKYIGVFGQPANEIAKSMDMTHPVIMEPQKMDMTHPVITEPQKIAMTKPVLMDQDSTGQSENMKFVLPSQYTTVEMCPRPTNSRVQLKYVPAKYIAALGFSGWYSPAAGSKHLSKLSKSLKRDQLIVTEDSSQLSWSVAQYHPPFTLPFLRLNEVWIELSPNNCPTLQDYINKKQQQQQLKEESSNKKSDL